MKTQTITTTATKAEFTQIVENPQAVLAYNMAITHMAHILEKISLSDDDQEEIELLRATHQMAADKAKGAFGEMSIKDIKFCSKNTAYLCDGDGGSSFIVISTK